MKEEGRKTGGEKEGERKVSRGKEADKGRKERCKVVYDSTGPNDHRYYVGKQHCKFVLFIRNTSGEPNFPCEIFFFCNFLAIIFVLSWY